jgi:hypothetical protein
VIAIIPEKMSNFSNFRHKSSHLLNLDRPYDQGLNPFNGLSLDSLKFDPDHSSKKLIFIKIDLEE